MLALNETPVKNPFKEMCNMSKSGFKTFNRAQDQGGLKRPTAGISGIFRGLDVSVQHSLSRRSYREDGRLSPRGGFETTSNIFLTFS
jgi:hypothetical protein